MDYISTNNPNLSDLEADIVGPAGLAEGQTLADGTKKWTPNQVLCIVLRGVCGFESVADICQREGITRQQFDAWRRKFARACQTWATENQPTDAQGYPVDTYPATGSAEA